MTVWGGVGGGREGESARAHERKPISNGFVCTTRTCAENTSGPAPKLHLHSAGLLLVSHSTPRYTCVVFT